MILNRHLAAFYRFLACGKPSWWVVTVGLEISRGSVIGVLMEYENGLVSVDPLGDFALLVTLSDNASNIARVRHLIKTSRNEILEALDIA